MDPKVDFVDLLAPLGCTHCKTVKTGHVYEQEGKTCVIIDVDICELSDESYVDYTSLQNEFMYRYDRVFRFYFDSYIPLD